MRNDLDFTSLDGLPSTPSESHSETAPGTPAVIPQPNTAPEYRRDPVTGRWVIVAPERSRRPMALEGAEPRHRANGEAKPCPFCPGQEHDTPHEVLAYRDSHGWRLRVVPNKYPAVRAIQSRERERPEPLSPVAHAPGSEIHDALYQHAPGNGQHEVVIECAEHLASPTRLSDEQLRDVFLAYRDRLLALAVEPDLRYAAAFKNVGAEAGASLGHCHSQIVATPFIPDHIEAELRGAKEYHVQRGRCVYCDILAGEVRDGVRLVTESPRFVALAPFASRFAYEVWVLPRSHASRYEEIVPPDAAELAMLMKRVLRSLDVVLAEPAYNWFLHTAPLRSPDLPHYHWHIELMPRTSRPAGYEWGTGCFINTVAPEAAATLLRAAT